VAASSIAIWFRLAGLNLTVSTGAVSGVAALYLATNAIRAGRAQRMLVVGVEPADPVGQRLFDDTASGAGCALPGFLFDGAAAVVLEAADAAAQRGATTFGLVGGYGRDPLLSNTIDRALSSRQTEDPLWMVPCRQHLGADQAAARTVMPAAGDLIDLSGVVGEASGALGVLQCAVAAHWLRGHPGRQALISTGGCWGEGYASLALRGAG
jgi:3-oxoacyl-[acyl-carrier-protein] synthase II